jgi:hypothetical protein
MAKKAKTTTKKTVQELPPLVVAADLKYPDYKSKDQVARDVGDYGSLQFYKTVGFGWCIATLLIARSRRTGTTDRTYATRCSDGASVRIGRGPHVESEVRVYVRKSRVKALQKYIDQYNSGAITANTTRDRISSRRAQGSLERAAGNRWWRWDV